MTIPSGDTADLVSRTYLTLRALIVHGRLAPGSRIIESELSSRLGISRTPVRSALHRLQQEGLVLAADTGKNARLSVAPLTRADGRELLNILGHLEGLASRWACSLPQEERAQLTGVMRRLNTDILNELEAEGTDPEQVFHLHSAFHQQPVDAVNAPRLRDLHRNIRSQVERYRRIYISSVPTGGFAAELTEHESIVESLDRGDPVAAQRAVEENWSQAGERLCRIIAAMGDRGSW